MKYLMWLNRIKMQADVYEFTLTNNYIFYLEMYHVYKSSTLNVEKCSSPSDTVPPANRVFRLHDFQESYLAPSIKIMNCSLVLFITSSNNILCSFWCLCRNEVSWLVVVECWCKARWVFLKHAGQAISGIHPLRQQQGSLWQFKLCHV